MGFLFHLGVRQDTFETLKYVHGALVSKIRTGFKKKIISIFFDAGLVRVEKN
jgi:hypothetical protein